MIIHIQLFLIYEVVYHKEYYLIEYLYELFIYYVYNLIKLIFVLNNIFFLQLKDFELHFHL